MTKREFLDTVFALAPNEANKIMDAFDEYVESNESDAVIFEEGRFICIEMGSSWNVFADSETGVMYVVSDGMYNRGTFTLLVDADGNPLIWEGVTE